MRIVIALGGNAMTAPDGSAGPDDQRAAIARAAEPIADLVAEGHQVLLTHGNGPQVGNLLRKNELAASVVPPVPLDWCVASTQATVGVTVMDALDVALAQREVAQRTAALVSRTVVDIDDPGFDAPTKPIGRHLTRDDAQKMIEHGQQFVEVPGKGWRRVTASPEPRVCLDAAAADTLLAAGFVVVCSGGGGIPTAQTEDGTLIGVEAVIDKDLTAALIADHIEADLLVIATDVDAVITGYGTDHEAPVGETPAAEMRAIAERERFAAGSMGPKVESVVRFAERGGTGLITSLARISEAVAGGAGTRVVPDRGGDATTA
ncbi:carbamate kinase [Nocardioides panacisoli]|uniref:carbamate kinase n=1 Tax=Nocardioides panacisoli TaxID=627624 RepID=UPI001C62C034|nr:carbamate kinase [Nocardioides panacisoli]QYJ02877.1 carbamate kinase [Nocardioides panacisoli]